MKAGNRKGEGGGRGRESKEKKLKRSAVLCSSFNSNQSVESIPRYLLGQECHELACLPYSVELISVL